MAKSATLYSILVASVVILAGCNPDRPPAAGRSDPVIGKQYPQISVLDGLEDILLFGPPITDRAPEQPIRVEVPIRAASSKELVVQYKFDFFDFENRVIEPQMGWRMMRLSPRAQHFMKAASLDYQTATWRLHVREAQ